MKTIKQVDRVTNEILPKRIMGNITVLGTILTTNGDWTNILLEETKYSQLYLSTQQRRKG